MLSEKEIKQRMHRCCFLFSCHEQFIMGHSEAEILIEAYVRRAIDKGYTSFLCGMNRGADLWAAQTVLRMRSIYSDKDIKLVAVLPFPDFGKNYTPEWKEQFDFLMQWCQVKYALSGNGCGLEAMTARDYWMVDKCTRLITDPWLDDSDESPLGMAKSWELDIDRIK